MPETSGIVGAGSSLGYCATASGTFSYIAEVVDIKPPEYTADFVEATHYLSPSSAEEHIFSRLEEGSRYADDCSLCPCNFGRL